MGDYGTLAQLGNPDGAGTTPPFIDSVLASGLKQGYTFTEAITAGTPTVAPAYTITSVPMAAGRTGYRQYFVDETGVVRFTADGTAVGVGSTPLS